MGDKLTYFGDQSVAALAKSVFAQGRLQQVSLHFNGTVPK